MRLLEALEIIRGSKKDAAGMNVLLASGFTPLHLRTFLQAELQLRFPDHHIAINIGTYGDIPGSLQKIDRSSTDAVVVLLEWEDLDPRLGLRQLGGWGPGVLQSIVEQSRLRLSQLQLLLEDLAGSITVVISLPTLPLPPLFFTRGTQASAWELALREQIVSFALKLATMKRIRFVGEQRLAWLSPVSSRLDVKSHWSSGFPYTLAHASALAELVAQLVHQPGPKKGLITDLDNTLWDGIIGDVGPEEISWDLDHESQGHGLYQQFLHALAQEGILIGVASKNDPKILDEVQNRADLLLPLTQIFPCDVSWGSKAKAVSRILKTWNVHADSVVFVDDNPLELAEVQAMFPEMMCLRFPAGNPNAIYDLLVTLRDLFGKTEISSEDEIRLESIRSSAAWRQATEESTEGFSETLLEQAQAELTVSLKKNPDDSRALELLNKTNQFNLNGRRFTEAEWQEYLEHSETFVLSVSYKDRFGPLGKVAIITGRPDGVKLSVDSWVMSCRAFARRIEHQCVKFLFDRFKSDLITFDYQETSRNSPVKMFFEQFLSNGLPFPPQISHSEFTARCPKLFHDLRELTDE